MPPRYDPKPVSRGCRQREAMHLSSWRYRARAAGKEPEIEYLPLSQAMEVLE